MNSIPLIIIRSTIDLYLDNTLQKKNQESTQ